MAESSLSDQEYAAQLGAVLSRRDPQALRGFLIENARRFGDPAQEAELLQQSGAALAMMMHRMIVSRPDLAAMHAESQRWLQEHGFDAPRRQGKLRRAPGPSSHPHQPKRS